LSCLVEHPHIPIRTFQTFARSISTMYSTATLFLVLVSLAQTSEAASVQQLTNNGQCLTVSKILNSVFPLGGQP
jgi:hypothetical protein